MDTNMDCRSWSQILKVAFEWSKKLQQMPKVFADIARRNMRGGVVAPSAEILCADQAARRESRRNMSVVCKGRLKTETFCKLVGLHLKADQMQACPDFTDVWFPLSVD